MVIHNFSFLLLSSTVSSMMNARKLCLSPLHFFVNVYMYSSLVVVLFAEYNFNTLDDLALMWYTNNSYVLGPQFSGIGGLP